METTLAVGGAHVCADFVPKPLTAPGRCPTMPRAIWTGAISFGLVNVPVRVYSAITEHDLHFNLLHEPDGGRIGYQKVCKAEEKPVPDDEVVKAFEVEKDEFVVLSDEDFEAAAAEAGARTIEITDFVPYDEIDPIYFERTYYLGPEEGSEKVYALLREAMEQSGLAAVARFVMRERQHVGALRVREGAITLERLYFADEIRPVDKLAPGKVKIDAKELKLASSLIEQFTGDWDPERYRDDYRDRLLEVVRAKQKGETVTPPAAEEEEQPADLLEALRASVEASKRSRSGSTSSSSRSRGSRSRKPSRRKTAKSRRS
jgi:DNA end-binding protein Ku